MQRKKCTVTARPAGEQDRCRRSARAADEKAERLVRGKRRRLRNKNNNQDVFSFLKKNHRISKRDIIADQRSPRRIRKPHGVANG